MVKIDIITYASGYNYFTYERFLGTLYNTGYNGNVYIITKSTDTKNMELIKAKYKNVIHIIDNIIQKTTIETHRFLNYLKLLKTTKINTEYILLCDFRDVLFQKNIENYNYDSNVDLYGFLEGKKIKDDTHYNTPWIKYLEKHMGINIYDNVADKFSICCGVTIGKIEAIKNYVNAQATIVHNYKFTRNIDQGIHNYLLHCNKLPYNIKLLHNDNELVNNMGTDIHALDADNNIVNRNNIITYIVHQYDRLPVVSRENLTKKHGFNFVDSG